MKRKSKFLPFKKARAYVRKLKIQSIGKWWAFSKTKRPQFIPSSPDKVYKGRGWSEWKDWLGHNHRSGPLRKRFVNDSYFKKWSPNMSYIFGLWFADGCITLRGTGSDSDVFSICLHKNDKYLLSQILREMKSNHKLKKRTGISNCCMFEMVSSELVSDVIKLGGKPRKSLDVKFPHVPKKYLPDFIRGNFDGDGTIYKMKRNKKSYIAEFCSGSKDFVSGLYMALKDNINGIRMRIVEITNKKGNFVMGHQLKKDSTYYRIIMTVNGTRLLRDYMYKTKSNLKMERKYKKHILNGEIAVSFKERPSWSFKKARAFVRGLGLSGRKDWVDYHKKNKLLYIPANCHRKYKDEWVDWYDWFGKKRPPSKEKLLKTRA